VFIIKTQWGRVSPTLKELVGTLYPRRKLHGYMDGDDIGWRNLSLFGWEIEPIKAYLIVYFIYLELFMLNNLI
jgi:hypothetical protein